MSGHRVVPPMVASGAHGAVAARAAVDDDALNAGAAVGQRLVDRALQFDGVAAAPAAVGGDHELGARILDAVLDGVGGEAAENHRVHGADAGAGLHGNHGLGNQGHVDDDAVAAADAGGLERVGETAYLAVQLGDRSACAHRRARPRMRWRSSRPARANSHPGNCARHSAARR